MSKGKSTSVISPSMVRRSKRPETDLEETLDMISTGLLLLEQAGISKVGGTKAVDLAARMNANYQKLEGLIKPLKERLKAEALSDNPTSLESKLYLRGKMYQAVINRFPKSYINLDKVKKYFGTRYPQYQTTREEVQITFDVKG